MGRCRVHYSRVSPKELWDFKTHPQKPKPPPCQATYVETETGEPGQMTGPMKPRRWVNTMATHYAPSPRSVRRTPRRASSTPGQRKACPYASARFLLSSTPAMIARMHLKHSLYFCRKFRVGITESVNRRFTQEAGHFRSAFSPNEPCTGRSTLSSGSVRNRTDPSLTIMGV